MTGKVDIVSSNSKMYKDKWPIGNYSVKEILFAGDLTPFKNLFGYRKIYNSFKSFELSEQKELLESLHLLDNERIFNNYSLNRDRKWNTLGFGTSITATIAYGILNNKKIISIPANQKISLVYKNSYWISVWDYLISKGYTIIVAAKDSDWVNEYKYDCN